MRNRKQVLSKTRKVVIKLGSRILINSKNNGVNLRFVERFAESVSVLKKAGKEIVIVSSGATGSGMARLGYTEKPKDIADRQACAAVGQIDLMRAYKNAFDKDDLSVGQILLTADDFRKKERRENLRNTLNSMLKHNVIPIINENDSVAVEEFRIGDNDKLSSDVALFWNADLLILFTDVDGLFDSNPKTNKKAKLLKFIPEISGDILSLAGKAGESGSAVSTGGMHSKLNAVQEVSKAGCNAFLANGLKVLPHQIFENAAGTLFLGKR